jgi:hypothetical protein
MVAIFSRSANGRDWPMESVHCAVEFGRYRGTADSGRPTDEQICEFTPSFAHQTDGHRLRIRLSASSYMSASNGNRTITQHTPPDRLEQLVAALYKTPPAVIAAVKALLPNEK